jgi:hypothetical protein
LFVSYGQKIETAERMDGVASGSKRLSWADCNVKCWSEHQEPFQTEKTAKLSKMTKHGHLNEIARRQGFWQGVFTRPRPEGDISRIVGRWYDPADDRPRLNIGFAVWRPWGSRCRVIN